jgi:hypothetical protein
VHGTLHIVKIKIMTWVKKKERTRKKSKDTVLTDTLLIAGYMVSIYVYALQLK